MRVWARVTQGFSMLEMMVAMIIIGVALLGFAAMTTLMMKGNRMARKLDEAATLIQSSIEELNAVNWDDIGNGDSLPAPNGLKSAMVRTEGPLNRNGVAIGTGTGPYIYYRHTVICTSADVNPTGASPKYCTSAIGDPARPEELSCDTLGLTAREKMIRTVLAWNSRAGECKFKAVDNLVFQ